MATVLEHPPTEEELKGLLIGAYPAWKEIEQYLFDHYQVETRWANGGKAGIYEYKFRSASRTLCGCYVRNGSFGFLVTFGRAERERFELARDAFSLAVQESYDAAHTYPDGKWVMLEVHDSGSLQEIERLLAIKKKPRVVQKKAVQKVDYKKTLKHLYLPPTRPEVIDVPPACYIMVDGTGDPQGKAYQEAMSILYSLNYTIKMSRKSGTELEGYFDYVIPPLEGLWWSPGGKLDLSQRDQWRWTSMIRQPEFVTPEVFAWAVQKCQVKKPEIDVSKARLEVFEEGTCVQMLHIGTYDQEVGSMAKLADFIKSNHYRDCSGQVRKHHEIYLSDPRKTVPERLKTVLRVPVERR